MTTIHPITSMTAARLAAKLLDEGAWTHINRVQARETIARMERAALAGPADGSPGAQVLAAHAKRLSDLACTAYEQDGLLQDRDLSVLWSPENMDAVERHGRVY